MQREREQLLGTSGRGGGGGSCCILDHLEHLMVTAEALDRREFRDDHGLDEERGSLKLLPGTIRCDSVSTISPSE